MSNENNPPASSRTDRAADLLDQAMARVASQLKTGTVNGGLLREIVALAKACGVELASGGQPLSPAVDDVMASLADIDPSVYEDIEYKQ